MPRFPFPIVALITLCALPLALRAQTPASVPLPAPLERVLRDYEAGWAKGDATGLARLFATDGFALPNHKPPAQGHTAIAAAYAGSGGALRLRALAYATSDSVGYIVGAYSYGERPGPDVGKFVLALRKDAGGRWLIAADIDNSMK